MLWDMKRNRRGTVQTNFPKEELPDIRGTSVPGETLMDDIGIGFIKLWGCYGVGLKG